MKKVLTALLVSALAAGTIGITASAESATEDVYVTIADAEGNLALIQEKVTVNDLDEDGVLTVDEALYAAHEAKFEGGAEAGYASSDSDYGRKLDMLWGTDNGGSYGYCVNNASALNLDAEVKNGDYINAYVYTDLVTWSDTYCYFDVNTVSVEEGEEVTLRVFGNGYDESFNPTTFAIEGVTIIIDDEVSEYVTDSEGYATFTIGEAGTHVISATFDKMTLVPPACVVTVSEKAEEPDTGDNNEGAEGDNNEGAEGDNNEGTEGDNPDTGVTVSAVSVIALGLALLTRKRNEK